GAAPQVQPAQVIEPQGAQIHPQNPAPQALQIQQFAGLTAPASSQGGQASSSIQAPSLAVPVTLQQSVSLVPQAVAIARVVQQQPAPQNPPAIQSAPVHGVSVQPLAVQPLAVQALPTQHLAGQPPALLVPVAQVQGDQNQAVGAQGIGAQGAQVQEVQPQG